MVVKDWLYLISDTIIEAVFKKITFYLSRHFDSGLTVPSYGTRVCILSSLHLVVPSPAAYSTVWYNHISSHKFVIYTQVIGPVGLLTAMSTEQRLRKKTVWQTQVYIY